MRDHGARRGCSGYRPRLTPTKSAPYNAVHNGGGQIVRRAQFLGALFFFCRAEEAQRRPATLPQDYHWRGKQHWRMYVSSVNQHSE